MVADISSLVLIMKGYKEDDQKAMNTDSGGGCGGQSSALITQDLLGERCSLDATELDLDLEVPSGWEKHLDLKSGKVYLQRCNSSNRNTSSSSSSSSSEHKHHSNGSLVPKLQDLNFPPSSKQLLTLFSDDSLDLKLISSASNYQSVCTLDKVKSALERAEKESMKKRSLSKSQSSSSPSDSSSSSTKIN